MSRRTLGLVLMLIGGEILGLMLGQVYFRLFVRTVPPLAMSSFNQSAAHAAFLFYGAVAGAVIWGWGILCVVLAGLFRSSTRPHP